MSKNVRLSQSQIDERVRAILKDYLDHPEALKMKEFIQHGDVSTYEHVLAVANRCYRVAYRRKNIDLKLLTVSAFLHDLYLYDWHDPDPSHKWHGFHHAERAAANAERIFSISPKGKEAIRTHMWPLTLTCVPKSREGWILTMADKHVSAVETVKGFISRSRKKT